LIVVTYSDHRSCNIESVSGPVAVDAGPIRTTVALPAKRGPAELDRWLAFWPREVDTCDDGHAASLSVAAFVGLYVDPLRGRSTIPTLMQPVSVEPTSCLRTSLDPVTFRSCSAMQCRTHMVESHVCSLGPGTRDHENYRDRRCRSRSVSVAARGRLPVERPSSGWA